LRNETEGEAYSETGMLLVDEFETVIGKLEKTQTSKVCHARLDSA
jgi:hypothetical protein